MKELLTKMFNGWADIMNQPESIGPPEETMAKYTDGNIMEAQLLILFSHWLNDVEAVAAHYGVGFAKLVDGEHVYNDGTVDTLLLEGKVVVVEIPPAPSPEHWWYYGKWNAPNETFTHIDLTKE